MLSLSFATRLLQSETRLPLRRVTVDISKQQRKCITKGKSQLRANLCLRSNYNETAIITSKSENAKRVNCIINLPRSRDNKFNLTPKWNNYLRVILSLLEKLNRVNILKHLSNYAAAVNNAAMIWFKSSDIAMSESDKVPQNYFGEKMSMLPFLKRRPKVRQTVKQSQSENIKPEAGGQKTGDKVKFISILDNKLENRINTFSQKDEDSFLEQIRLNQRNLLKTLTLNLSMLLSTAKQNGIAVNIHRCRTYSMSTERKPETVGKKFTSLPPLGPRPILQPPPAKMPALPSCPKRESKKSKKDTPCKKITSLTSGDSAAILFFPIDTKIIPAATISTINVLLQPVINYFNYDDSETVITRSSFDVCEISEDMASLYE